MLHLHTLALTLLALSASLVGAELQPHHKVLDKRAPVPQLPGVSKKNLRNGNLAIGFIPGWGEPKAPSNTFDINKLLPKPMSMVGTYYYLSKSDPKLNGLDNHFNELLQQKASFGGDHPVYVIAMGLPSQGLSYVNANVAKAIATKMAYYNSKNVTVYLRFAWEMNGDWYSWGTNPSGFLKAWKLVYNAVKANKGARKTYLLWSPNSRFGGLNDVKGGWNKYWPGANYVDLVGLSFYSYGGFDRENIAAKPSFLTNMLSDFSKNFAAKYKKPMILSETASAWTINLDSGKPNTGGDSQLKIKSTWMRDLLNKNTQKKFPYYQGFTWFNIIKDESATGNSPVREEDFRCLLGDKNVQKDALKQLGKGV